MIFDETNLFSDNQTFGATEPSENVIDLGENGVPQPVPEGAPSVPLKADLGAGTEIDIVAQLTADVTGTPGTLEVELQTDSDEGFGSPKTVLRTPIPGDKAGSRCSLQYVPLDVDERYFRLNYVVTGGTAPGYQVTAGLVMARDHQTI